MFALRQKLSCRLARHFPSSTVEAHDFGPIVSFTFDDAPVSAATLGAPILEDEGVRGTYYLSGGMLGGHSDIQPIMSAAQAHELSERGHEIACHSFDHLDVHRQSLDGLSADLEKNRRLLTEVAGTAPTNFAYPYGRVSYRTKQRLQSQFRTCRGIYPGINIGKIDLGLLKAVPLYESGGGDEVNLGWIDVAARQGGWLIFITHDVQDSPTRFGTQSTQLRAYVRAAQRAGCACMPVNRAINWIEQSRRAAAPGEAKPVPVTPLMEYACCAGDARTQGKKVFATA